MTEVPANLLIFGASARAAAFSALRAGLQPWAADLFGDTDLLACCPTMRVPPELYPRGFLALVGKELPGPWLYTGGMENYRYLVGLMAKARPLWGNDEAALALARSPVVMTRALEKAYLPVAALGGRDLLGKGPPPGQRWLLKPLIGAGGSGIERYTGTPRQRARRSYTAWLSEQGVPPLTAARDQFYLQEHIEGEPCSALYCGTGDSAQLLGVTQQLVGTSWVNAGPFQYAGSIGPIAVHFASRPWFLQIGVELARTCRLRGLFGVDAILRDGRPYVVEVNPRYTASVEVLEHALGRSALRAHQRVFEPGPDESPWNEAAADGTVVGKAVLYARSTFAFPADGPWTTPPSGPWELTAYADVPAAGERMEAGRPVLSFLARAVDRETCEAQLREIALGLEERFAREPGLEGPGP